MLGKHFCRIYRISKLKPEINLQTQKPITKETGRVIIEVRKILVITLLLSLLGFLSIANTDTLFTVPVDTGMPRVEHNARVTKADASWKNPLRVSEFSLNLSNEDKILLPLSKVETNIISDTVITIPKEGAA